MNTPTLNQGQQAAVDGFFAFLMDPEQKEMIISGPGGVGKSFTVAQMIDTVMQNYFDNCKMFGIEPIYKDVVVTATTNKAAEVLTKSMGYPAQTIHSYMNLRVQENTKTGEMQLTPTGEYTVKENTVIFVDEYSMICRQLRRFLSEGVSSKSCKIVYVGDHCQLAPVKEDEIVIANRGLPTYHLTEQMRTNVPELQALNAQLRETVETGIFKPIKVVPGIIDLYTDEQMEAALQADFAQQNPDVRILAYSNKRVQEYNDYIRWLRQLDAAPHVGELLICNSAVKVGFGKNAKMIATEAELEVVNVWENEMVTISEQSGDTFEIECYVLDVKTSWEKINNVYMPVDKNHWNQLIRYYANRKEWVTYFKLKQQFADLRPRDASTVHKAQGSTFDHVYIDLTDISRCTQGTVAARLLNVAFTRARTRIIMHGNLTERMGGLLLE
ncbi:Dda-like helicase [Stenotrophomonas phage Philippe]|uniref:DNA helicase n=1 Tax=Stenotrophomonas phage Philippe TaxID=2859655 RepID=A0AAE8BI43_9CAUD|nr:Dda-like helicase [Stenotrophomonas phage Philippe]QYW02259.1 DNA helicase [Stenotrophomonas phage Philippe]